MPTISPSRSPSSAPTPRLKIRKIGSDPEAQFVQLSTGQLVPATKYVGTQRSLQSWIGTDGCSSTAELRPRPAHDVRLHVRDIAEALSNIDRIVCQKDPDIALLAQPHYERGGPCGGHIHASFTLYDPLSVDIILNGAVWNVAGETTRGVPHATRPPALSPLASRAYVTAAREGHAFSFAGFARRMRHVIEPLENNLFLQEIRQMRSYGSNEDAVRSEYAAKLVSPGVVNWRIEYRYPSTWLAHPAQALLYLGLTKLVVNNYHSPVFSADAVPPARIDQLHDWLTQFLGHPETVVTDDTKSLPKILRFVVAEVQPKLRQPLVPVDFPAWTTFLNHGRFK